MVFVVYALRSPPTDSKHFMMSMLLLRAVPLKVACSQKWAIPSSCAASEAAPALISYPQYTTGDADGKCMIRNPFANVMVLYFILLAKLRNFFLKCGRFVVYLHNKSIFLTSHITAKRERI